MKRYRRGAFDMSSFMWTMMSWGKDKENGYEVEHEGKKVYINSGVYGYDNTLGRLLDCMKAYKLNPIDVILVFEGQNSKGKRLLIDNQYKGGGGSSRPPEAYVEFEKCREMLKTTFRELGAQLMWQDFAEGDDTLGWLAHNTEDDLIVFTFDNDLTVLNLHPNAYGARVSTWINEMFEHNKYGVFDYHLTTTYKALVGDSSDNIKGCPGFGPKKFEALCEQYGFDGLAEIHQMLVNSDLSPLADYISGPQDKLLQMILDNAAQVIRCFDLARIRPDWVNTMRQPLHWEAGMVRQLQPTDIDPRLKAWYGRTRLITGDVFDEAVAWAAPKIAESREVALDIETSSADESDEWLARKGAEDGVDVFGSTLTGLSLTFGPNNQYTFYFSVDHADTDNVDSEELRQFIARIECPIVVQNCSFEAAVLWNAWGAKQMDNGFRGYLQNMLDTKLEANYVDENISSGLKQRSHGTLGYRQQTYEETCTLTDHPSKLLKGGQLVREEYEYQTVGTGKFEPLSEEEIAAGMQPVEITKRELVEVDGEPVVATQTRRYKMNELPATHVLSYGADDTICTVALHNYYKLFMQLEHTWQVYLQVEIAAIYANASAFTSGIAFSMERMMACEAEDAESVAQAWPVLRQYLIDQGWEGTAAPTYTVDITPAQIKEAYQIVTGERLDTMMRTPSKIVTFIKTTTPHLQFAEMLDLLVQAGAPEILPELRENTVRGFNKYVRSYFKGEPQFSCDSPNQMKHLMYEVLQLPVRLRNKLTDIMRKNGIEGTPKTDDLAIQTALHYDATEVNTPVLKAIQIIKQCSTRSKLFYRPYRAFPHWLDGLLHPSTNQCATVTRRNSASDPNYTQWPAKGEGIKFRECVVPRAPGRVIVSSDCSGQELRLAADWSRDPNMLSCYIGENKRDIHSMVASAATKYFWERQWSYEEFYAALRGEDEELGEVVDALRSKSKAVTFGEIYGSMAKSLSERLMISEEEAQLFLDAKKAQFPLVDVWKDSVVAQAKETGYSLTKLGARRHMAEIFRTGDKWQISRAERQLSNFCIQSSGAEAIKIALGKCFFSEVMRSCDVHIIGSIHDEIVLDCPAEHAYEVATELVKFLEAPYADMIVPFVSETTIGTDFGKQLKLPLGFTPEDVNKVLSKLFPSREKLVA